MGLKLEMGNALKHSWYDYAPKILNLGWSNYFNDIVASSVTKEGKSSSFYSLDTPLGQQFFNSQCWSTSEGHCVLSNWDLQISSASTCC